MPPVVPVLITVAGRMDDVGYQQCKAVAQDVARVQIEVEVQLIPMLECDWEKFRDNKVREFGGKAFQHADSPMVYYNDAHYIGDTEDFLEFAVRMYGVRERGDNSEKYSARGDTELEQYLKRSKKQYVFMDVTIGESLSERLTIELFHDKCPKTCENFRMLCTGDRETGMTGVKLHYRGTPIHRIVPGGWIQGGDITKGRGNNGYSIYGPTFPDESFDVPHDSIGVVAMASTGVHTNNSQFFISLRAMPNLNGRKVAFGRVVLGLKVLRAIGRVEAVNQRPVEGSEVVISNCGECSVSVTALRSQNSLVSSLGLPLDLRRARTKRACLDLRRPATKARLLGELFDGVDEAGRRVVSQEAFSSELGERSSSAMSMAASFFPKHAPELAAAVERMDGERAGEITREEFLALGAVVLSVPGGRTDFTKPKWGE